MSALRADFELEARRCIEVTFCSSGPCFGGGFAVGKILEQTGEGALGLFVFSQGQAGFDHGVEGFRLARSAPRPRGGFGRR